MLKNRLIPLVALAALVTLPVRAQGPDPKAVPAADAALGLPANPAAGAPAEPPTDAEKTLDEAIKKLTGLKSVSADVLQSVVMLSQKFRVEGTYLRAPENKIYLKLDVKGLGDSKGTMLQVCDGQTLWDVQQVLEGQVYRKVGKIAQIMEKVNSPELDAKLRDQILSQYLRLTGPESLLTGLRKTIKFTQKDEETLDGKPVWVLHGEWKSREGLITPDNRPLPPLSPLPAYIPSLVTLLIDKETGWPYRVKLVGRKPTMLVDNRPRGPDGRPIGSLKSVQPVEPSEVELSYSNVKLNPPLEVARFAYQAPAEARVQDETDAILNGLEQAIQVQAAKKTAAAAAEGKGEEPLLKQSIDVPKPPAALK